MNDSGEECDDGNLFNTDACLNTCLNARCGDNFVQAGVEECDDGNTSDGDACLNSCLNARCGDGHVRLGVEECDDGNTSDGDWCSSACLKECPSPGTFYGGHCYFLITTGANRAGAGAACFTTYGGGTGDTYLVTISSAGENGAVTTLAGNGGVNRNVWLGLTQVALGVWGWPDTGEPLVYTNWAGGEPNGGAGWDGAYLSSTTGFWSDSQWGTNYPFICEHYWH